MKLTKTKLSVLITVAVLFISMFGCFLFNTNFLTVKQTNVTVTTEKLVETINKNQETYNKDLGDPLTQASKGQISMVVYQPKNATASNPAPAIVMAHGWNNSKEMQNHNFIELAKRGFVCVSVDLAGHGRTDVALLDESGKGAGNTEGALAALEYTMSLPYVDATQVSCVGHSAGDLALCNAIKLINTVDSKRHVKSFYCPAGTMAAFLLTRDAVATSDLVLGVSCGKYDELDTKYFGVYDIQNSMFAKLIMSAYYPGVMTPGTEIPLGRFYGLTGEVTLNADGTLPAGTRAIYMTNPALTHPGAVFSTETTATAIDFFYAVHGVPAGAKKIASNKQSWVGSVVFQTMGLLAFFASSVVFAYALLKTKKFADLNREVPSKEELPSILDWREIVLILVTFIPLVIFAYKMYFPCFDDAANVISSEGFPDVVNGIVWYTCASGLFAFLMIGVNYIVRRLLFIGKDVKISSVLEVAKVDNASHFVKTVLFSVAVVVLMFIPCIISYFVFGVNFGISVYVVGVPRLQWLPEIITKYLPIWLFFLVANAALNAKCRYKEVPECCSIAFVTLANFLPIFILTMKNYDHLVKEGETLYTFGDPSIFAFNLFAPMILIGITNRLLYKKTGNVWAAAIINASILTLMALTITRHTTDIALFL